MGARAKVKEPLGLASWVIEKILTGPRCIVWVQAGMQTDVRRGRLAQKFLLFVYAKQARG